MLGKLVEVTVDRPVNGEQYELFKSRYKVYRGHIHTLTGQKPVFYMGDTDSGGMGSNPLGTVIAIADKGTYEQLVVAPVGSIYYEPEIRNALAVSRDAHLGKLICLYEKSCGAVVFRRDLGELRFLLVKNKNGCHWGFPKGHVEIGETEQQTAIREVLEETGLEVSISPGFRETSQYRPFGKIKKQVVFFIAQSEQNQVKIQQTEIDRFQWATCEEAAGLFRYENDARILRSAVKWISGH